MINRGWVVFDEYLLLKFCRHEWRASSEVACNTLAHYYHSICRWNVKSRYSSTTAHYPRNFFTSTTDITIHIIYQPYFMGFLDYSLLFMTKKTISKQDPWPHRFLFTLEIFQISWYVYYKFDMYVFRELKNYQYFKHYILY